KVGDVFLYFVGVPVDDGRFRLPLRAGPYVHETRLEEDSSDSRIDWSGYGLRADVAPEYWFVIEQAFSFGLSGDLNAGAHYSQIDAKVPSLHEHFDGYGATYGVELGVQALFSRHYSAWLGYIYRSTIEAESNSQNGVVVNRAEVTFNGIGVRFGVRF